MYKLDNTFARSPFTVLLVGCGGTGGFLAEGLRRVLPPQARLILVDHDRVEERNLLRQNFTSQDIGRFKSEALAYNLARKTGRPVGYSIFPVAMMSFDWNGLVLGCVDNGPARRDIAQKFDEHIFYPRWWVDAGNGENYGQILIGNETRRLLDSFEQESETCLALPLPTIQMPTLLAQAPRTRDCAEAVLAGEQGPTINQTMAALMLEAVLRLIEGTCSWMQLYLDMEAGSLVPVLATPEAVEGVTGIKKRKLMKKEKEVHYEF